MTDAKREKILETAKQVAEVLARNDTPVYDISRIFSEAQRCLTVALDQRER